MAWLNLRTEIGEMFSALIVDFHHRRPWREQGMMTRDGASCGSSIRKAKKEEKRLEKQRKRDNERWAALKAAPLQPVEKNGVIWMMPPPELDEIRERHKLHMREVRAEQKLRRAS